MEIGVGVGVGDERLGCVAGRVYLVWVTVSMRVMSAGDGCRYLLKSVAAGDGDRSLSSSLTRYYVEEGTPPGRWLGAGMRGLADGQIAAGDVVSESQLRLLVGEGRDPVSGVPLGRAHRIFAPEAARVAARVAALDAELIGVDRAAVVARIEGEEAVRGTRRAVAGFDFTFSVPKSASVLWAVGDPHVREAVEEAHRAAVSDVLGFMEREVAATRMGASDGSGAVVQANVAGLIATAFDHFDSRAGDPHLHTHVVIANKARTSMDGQWRSLDGRPFHASVVALSELHEALFADRLTGLLGVGWKPRAQGRDRNPSWAISSVPERLIKAFSSRSRDIDVETDRLISAYVASHGHRPAPAAVIRLRGQATLSTRPEKQIRSLPDLTAEWRERAEVVLGMDPVGWARRAVDGVAPGALRAGDVTAGLVARWGDQVVALVGEKRSTWRHWNLVAETARQTMGWRFATSSDREQVMAAIVAAAEHASIRLTPSELTLTPERFRRMDRTSRFRPRYTTVYSSTALFAAEDRLLEHGRDLTGPRVPLVIVEACARGGRRLGVDQADAVAAIARSGRVLDVLVGPAGAGKTTAMLTLRRVWEAGHGAGSVIGLAPSAAAADVLAGDLRIGAENTAKWLHDQRSGAGAPLRRGQLVIVDEASLAGTTTLEQIAAMGHEVGAKLLLVGDHAQLQAVDAGGAFAMLAQDRDTPPELTDVRRFRADWEKTASLALRSGDAAVIEAYATRGRIVGGDLDAVTERAFTAWRADVDSGRASVLIADNASAVLELNLKARADRIRSGAVDPRGAVRLHDGAEVSVGDVVITRRNDRLLRAGRGWVRNGDRWRVLRTSTDGTVVVRRAGRRWSGIVRLPAGYVSAEVELGYAITTHRAQGATVDTSHAIITPGSTREAAYVAMTRGRNTNTAYVATDQLDELHTAPHPSDLRNGHHETTAQTVLAAVLAHSGAERSAHDTLRDEQDTAASIRVLAAEYDTIATAAQHDRWTALIHASPLDRAQADAVLASDAFGSLGQALRRAEAAHHNLDTLLPRVIAAGTLGDATDIAAVLTARLERATRLFGAGRYRRTPRLIVGLIPEATGPMPTEMAEALRQRHQLMEARAAALALSAIQAQHAWTIALGTRPTEVTAGERWDRQVQVVAAYRDRHSITTNTPLGAPADSLNQQREMNRAAAAIHTALQVGRPAEVFGTRSATVERDYGHTLGSQ